MAKTGATLKTPATAIGIIDLEFAYSSEKAFTVINAWKNGPVDKIPAAKNNTFFDFIFLFFYSLFLYHTCKLIAVSFSGFLWITGRLTAKLTLAAGLLDVFENVGMLITLQGHISDGCSLLTFIFSITKWIIILAAVMYIITSGSLILYQKIKTD